MNRVLKILNIIILLNFSLLACKSKDENRDRIYTESYSSGKSILNDKTNDTIAVSRHNALTRAIKYAEPAIVGINITEVRQVVYQDPFDSFFDDPIIRKYFGNRQSRRVQEYEVQGLGSGFIISSDGYILTNHHVAGAASKIVVTMTDGKKYDAEIIGADYTSDVALLKIKANNLPFLKLGNSDDILVGEWAIAFGNPFGLFDLNAKPTVTVGVISNFGINFSQDNRVYKGMLQTDAAISSGNSGGPLMNALGEVVGINTVIFSTSQSNKGAGSIGIGWAIPINRVKKVIDMLAKNKSINRNFDLGIEVREIDEEVARYLRIEKRDGLIVLSVNSKLSAGQAGIEPGDIILEVDGQKVTRDTDFYLLINDNVVGDKIVLKILRDGKENNITVKLIEKAFPRGRR